MPQPPTSPPTPQRLSPRPQPRPPAPAHLSLADGVAEDDYGCGVEEDVSQVPGGGVMVGGPPNRGHLGGCPCTLTP